MSDVKNIIQKQVLDASFNSIGNTLELRNEISDWCKEQLAPEIELSLDMMAPEKEFIRIDKISIEVSVKEFQNWQHGLAEQIGRQLRQQIQNKLDMLPGKETIQPAEENFYELLRFYLEKGYLPWWADINTGQEFETKLQEWLQSNGDNFTAGLLQLLSHDIIRQRIAYQFPLNSFILLIAGITNSQQEKIRSVFQDVSLINSHAHALLKLSSTEYEQIFRIILLEKISFLSTTALKESIEIWLQQVISDTTLKIGSFMKQMRSEEFVIAVNEIIMRREMTGGEIKENTSHDNKRSFYSDENIEQADESGIQINKQQTGFKDKKSKQEPYPQEKDAEDVETNRHQPGKKDQKSKQEPHPQKKDAEDVETNRHQKETKDQKSKTEANTEIWKIPGEAIYINNAGVVIIATFLPSFFNRLFIADRDIINDISMAVCMANFIVTGNETMAEFELILPKILCGAEPGLVINTNIQIATKAIEEVNNLLSSVIEHWSVLKNTSIEGLRESFLQRNGKLSFKNNEWLLQVEQNAYDMLLADLPWSINMIKLPWMQYLLKTEWIN